jgi:hypothetical protein
MEARQMFREDAIISAVWSTKVQAKHRRTGELKKQKGSFRG